MPRVEIGRDGKATPESESRLLKAISDQAGHGGRIEGARFVADDKRTAQMNRYAQGREAENSNPRRQPYDLRTNNCATFVDKTIEAGGVKLPPNLSAKPNGQINTLQSTAGSVVVYDPTQKEY